MSCKVNNNYSTMEREFWDEDYLKSRGLIFGGKYLPYNPNLQERAKEMRKNLTLAERRLWVSFLQKYNKRGENKITILKQKVIDNYIVDFYIPNYKLVIEVDGESHVNREGYDEERTNILNGYGLQEIRFSNYDIFNNFETVCNKLKQILSSSPL
ncbi:MAG: DUF559 domain-containing protein [Candidatus Gracilibacteria bacterium]|nr:DUF559 domain-containing protein [Candidatus Gracilibacteria bacterium]